MTVLEVIGGFSMPSFLLQQLALLSNQVAKPEGQPDGCLENRLATGIKLALDTTKNMIEILS